jgi:hypothetical protein
MRDLLDVVHQTDKCHWVFTFFLPRRVKRPIPLFFKFPNTGSTMAIRLL